MLYYRQCTAQVYIQVTSKLLHCRNTKNTNSEVRIKMDAKSVEPSVNQIKSLEIRLMN